MRAALPWLFSGALVASAALGAPNGPHPASPVLASPPPPPLLSAPPPPPPLSLSAAPGASAFPDLPGPGDHACREHVPDGKGRPKLTESAPAKGQSGHALTLTLTLEHGKGETVLPGGFQAQGDDPNIRALERAGLYLPDPDGGAGPALARTESGERAITKLEISFVPLPSKPGRNTLVIPPLPISIARASGDVLVLCTSPHEVQIEDPIANTSNPTPRQNPSPRAQREEWVALKNGLLIGAVAVVLGAIAAWLLGKWLRRARPVPPPPPPRPPWEVALEELFDVRHAGLIAEGRLAEHFDRVSDTLRKYLGARFGFDGLESTTREALGVLRGVTPVVAPLEAIETFLRQADLVKFAKTVPSADDGELALVRAEHIVRETLPAAPPPGAPPPPGAAPLTPDAAPLAPPSAPEAEPAPPPAVPKREPSPEEREWGPKPPTDPEVKP